MTRGDKVVLERANKNVSTFSDVTHSRYPGSETIQNTETWLI